MPAPYVPTQLLPESYSASRYQILLNCPYRFFAAECLRLQAPEEVREVLAKNDYGERIHRILEIFHNGGDRTGPFPAPITARRRAEAIAQLADVSQQVFADDLDENFLHRGWLQRWLVQIPAYIDWQIARETDWRVGATEVNASCERRSPTSSYTLRGRLDRIDHGRDGIGIVDYKTGTTADASTVAAGEAVQLPCYALICSERVQRVEYLRLDGEVKSSVILDGEQLQALAEETGARLDALVEALYHGAPLPAWGDDDTCRYCDFDTLCRRQTWLGEDTGD
jgi:ATP-dependent helicase/nuclease subunit B